MLGEDLERAIEEAWLRIRQSILSDPDELHRRLARRRTKTLTRPPRPWCIALRASNRRITPAHWVIHPQHAMDLDHPEHPYEPMDAPSHRSNPLEQTVLRRACFGRITKTSRHPDDSPQFLGYRWICPGCKKQVEILYYPLPVRTLFDSRFIDPLIQLKLTDADLLHPPPPTFACRKCHDIYYFSSIHRGAWNDFIAYLSGGLLYSCEVQKPASFIPQRKRTRTRQLNRAAPAQRQVLTRLSNGWSDFQIARDLRISINTVRWHVWNICRQEDVADRQALAQKLNFTHSPPLNITLFEAPLCTKLPDFASLGL